MNINITKAIRVKEKGTYTNINTNEKYIVMLMYLPSNDEDTILKYGLFNAPINEVYKHKKKYYLFERGFAKELKPVRYSKSAPWYFEDASVFYRANGSCVREEEKITYCIELDFYSLTSFIVDWITNTIIKVPQQELPPGKYKLRCGEERYITIKNNGKFKITFE